MNFKQELAAIVSPDRILTRPVDLAVYATDASLYRIMPQAVVRPRTVEELRALFTLARRERMPLTFRAGGTSLSGQALGAGVVVDCVTHWRNCVILEDGRRVRVGPGVIAGLVNRRLAPLGFKLGPDPASIDACTIGGVVANNSSGMCCGVERNAYRTLESLSFLLPSGTFIDSSARDAGARLRDAEPRIWAGIGTLRDRIRSNLPLMGKIRRKYSMKNTMGYGLNSFVDFEDPLEILWHLLVGSEGTLAFITEAVFAAVPDLPHKATGLLFFESVRDACAAIAPLRESQAAALELMDRASLRSVEGKPGVPDFVPSLPGAVSALLVEHQAAAADELARLAAGLDDTLANLPLLRRTAVTRDASEQADLWAVRKGIMPSVGAVRRRGTTLVTEDVAFPVEALADGVLGLQDLFRKHGYEDSVIFGHAKDGNLHFLLSQGASEPREVDRFSAFLEDLARFVIGRHEGALKAEHGTGRNMAPFVEMEWGPDAYEVMCAVKNLVDPEGILNPGVLLNRDPQAHVANLKTIPAVDEETDRCIECGFCEVKCPSRDLTLTPRQRIMVQREVARLKLAKLEADADALENSSLYNVLDTCATDGLCATACPVTIDTGRLVKRLRAERHGDFAAGTATWLGAHFNFAEKAARAALRAGHGQAALLGHGPLTAVTRAVPIDMPKWAPDMPRAGGALPATRPEGAAAVYFPACITRVFGPGPGEPSLAETVVTVCARAGIPVWIPPSVAGTCCGMPFSSKGYAEAHVRCAEQAIERLFDWSRQGRLPVIIDTSPCAYTLKTCRDTLPHEARAHFDELKILDSVEFARDAVLPKLQIHRRARAVALHPVCSIVKMGLGAALRDVTSACAVDVFIALEAGCCGFAGDRGFIHPELTEAATRAEAAEILARPLDGYYASSRTCEVGMSRATGRPWRSFWSLLEWASQPGLQ